MERSTPWMASMLVLVFSLLWLGPDLCVALNADGRALLRFKEGVELDPYGALSDWDEESIDPCSWFGVGCSDGQVVALNMKDLLLKGTLAPELGKLVNMRLLILHNNSFYGVIPKEISELEKLEVLDLGYNNLSGSLPSDLIRILSLGTLILRSNKFTGSISAELHELNMLSELCLDEDILSSNRGSITRNVANATVRRLMELGNKPKGRHHRSGNNHTTAPSPSPSPSPSGRHHKSGNNHRTAPSPSSSPSPSPSHAASPSHLPEVLSSPTPTPSSIYSPPSPVPTPDVETSPSPSPSPINDHPTPAPSHHPLFDPPAPSPSMLMPSLPSSPLPQPKAVSQDKHNSFKIYMSILGGVSFLVASTAVYFLCCQANKVVMVRPWATGLSGQLQKAFITGVPSLKRSELEKACEDFSNIIGSLPDCILYKGTLSSGVEIAVASSLITSAKDWSKQSESQFRMKISTLSKVNHKNFVNLLGYCEEEEPFTRMMVFEYAPNGTLFEHLHIKEAERLNWATRLRIAMGIAYCLQHIHQIDPPVILRDLNSSSIHLTDDYAAKISDLRFWSDTRESEPGSGSPDPLDATLLEPESIVYKFGIILLELLSGRLPFSQDHGLLVHWASCYLNGERPVKEMIDKMLTTYREEDIGELVEVVRSCIDPNPKRRPTMAEVAERLREITAMPPDGATPKLSPLWWAELEIISEAS